MDAKRYKTCKEGVGSMKEFISAVFSVDFLKLVGIFIIAKLGAMLVERIVRKLLRKDNI